jgi:hypothetical protein
MFNLRPSARIGGCFLLIPAWALKPPNPEA